jgi:hypothetical protein
VVVSVEGAACTGGGQPCTADSGLSGACALGTTACKQGALACVPQRGPMPEQCNGVDDDCNALIDDDAPCDGDQVCFHGRCQPKCGTGEFVCPHEGQKCDLGSGLCVEADCLKISCPEGETCLGGACVAPCEGVVCPARQVCLGGECVELCAGVSCTAGEVCVAGACVPGCTSCGGLTCAAALACDTTTGACIDPTCPYGCAPGTVCSAGACVDACSAPGVRCPGGRVCSQGSCVPESGANGPGDVPIDLSGGGATSRAGSSGVGDANGSTSSGEQRRFADPGCACRAAGTSPGWGAWLAGLVLLASGCRRRKV